MRRSHLRAFLLNTSIYEDMYMNAFKNETCSQNSQHTSITSAAMQQSLTLGHETRFKIKSAFNSRILGLYVPFRQRSEEVSGASFL